MTTVHHVEVDILYLVKGFQQLIYFSVHSPLKEIYVLLSDSTLLNLIIGLHMSSLHRTHKIILPVFPNARYELRKKFILTNPSILYSNGGEVKKVVGQYNKKTL